MSDSIENNRQCSFLKRFREHTHYTAFKKALIDSQSLSSSDESLLKALHIMLVSGVFLLLLALGVNLLIAIPKSGSELGTFGDFLGGVLNPIFTLMTFFGVIVTIALQKLELRAAREEYKKSADALSTQAIENTFFSMLDLHHRIVENLNFSTDNFNFNGHELDNPVAKQTASSGHFSLSGSGGKGAASFGALLNLINTYSKSENDTIKIYTYIQNNHNHLFGHYFRNLYQIVKFIDTNHQISNSDKRKYMSILRSQISTNETSALFINCFDGVVDDGKFRYLLVKYHLLEHMPITKVRDNKGNLKYSVANFSFYIANSKTIQGFLSHDTPFNGAFGKKNLDFGD
ncbi:putative phage abortive infection protein [Aeromonas caviae]|uniref:putative phage abortive infection protein n=1 Tax=Aeromonas caviae TaxID=648 RepID=UPI00244A7577|nr:putative phage abortive infection protein [Aeromonas caviae]MDH0308073.1 putative phage abortive infection protein [Aeromonas caviae]